LERGGKKVLRRKSNLRSGLDNGLKEISTKALRCTRKKKGGRGRRAGRQAV